MDRRLGNVYTLTYANQLPLCPLQQYLDALNLRNPRAALPHAHRLVKLYASYSREQLLPFLRSSHHYPLNEALALCRSLNYVPETVYLLTRVGRRKDALRLLMEKVGAA